MTAARRTIPSAPRRLRATLKWLHLWLGLSAGLVFALVALSGTLLTYQREALLWAHPQLAQPALPDAAALGATWAGIVDHWQPHGLRGGDLPHAGLPVWVVRTTDGGWHYLDPASGALLLTRTPANDWLLWLRDLHVHLLAGERGEAVLGVAGIIALLLLLSGLYLWWPRAGMLRASVTLYSGPPPRRWLSWHRSPGVLLLPLLLVVTLTGVAMVYHGAASSVLRGAFGDAAALPPPAPLAVRDRAIDWSALFVAADHALPAAELRRIALPTADNALVAIRARGVGEWHPVGRSVVWLDPYRAQVVRVHDATTQGTGARASDAIYPLHGGFVGGRGWQAAVALSGLLPPLLLVTGFLFWRARRRRPA